MRLTLPILLLTANAAWAQPAEKPYIFDAVPRIDLKGFDAPRPATPAAPTETPRPLPESSFQDDSRIRLCGFAPPSPVTIGPGPSEMHTPAPPVQTELGCAKPDAPKPPAKSVG